MSSEEIIMQLHVFTDWVQSSSVGQAMAASPSLFPLVECLHVLFVAVMMGTIAFVDLRLMGLINLQRPASKTLREMLPFTVGSFLVVTVTGTLLWTAHPLQYLQNGPFVAKMVLLAAAGINILVFHGVTQRSIRHWDLGQVPMRVLLAGCTSLLLWVAVVACGRWIGFTYSPI